jgi:O-antigen ligase
MQQNIVNFLDRTFFVNCLLGLLPISFILGNLAINLNTVLIIFTALYIFIRNNSNFDIVFFDKLISIYFFYILSVGIFKYAVSTQSEQDGQIIIKSITHLRYLMFYLAVRFLIGKNLINLKILFYISSLCVLFVSLDIIYQFTFGQDIFGFAGNTRRLGGPFGDELIAGGYLQRFSFFLFFAFFTFNYFEKIPKKVKFFLFCFFSVIISFALILAGNRVPFVLFLLIIFLIFFFDKNKRIYFFSLAFITITTLIILCSLNSEIRYHYAGFQKKVISLFLPFSEDKIIKFKDANNPSYNEKNYTIPYKGQNYIFASVHIKEFYSAYKTWSSNKFFGGGVKTFRYNCPKTYHNCNNHPHNYYLEILTDLGVIGFLLIVSFFILITYKSFLLQNPILSPFLFIFIGEFFPFRTTGSFFTTFNATFIFLLISIIVSILVRKDLNKNL